MKKSNVNNNLSELVYILDRSGSMSGMSDAAVEAFNDFLAEQQKVEGEATLTQVLFDTRIERPVDAQPIDRVRPMQPADFQPRSCTALLDAIGLSIKATRARLKAMPEEERPGTVIFAIFTDGLENASKRYTWEKISKRIERRTERDGWQFLFLAANQDAIATGARMRIQHANSANVRFNEAGVSSQGNVFNRKVSALRRRATGKIDEHHSDLVGSMSTLAEEEHTKSADKKKRKQGSKRSGS